MDVQSIDRLPYTASRIPEIESWPPPVGVGEAGKTGAMSGRALEMLNRYSGLTGLYNVFGPSMFAFAVAQLWHDEKDKSESVDTIMRKASSNGDFSGKIADYFNSKSDSTETSYLARGFSHLRAKGSKSASQFYDDLKIFLGKAATLSKTEKADMRKAARHIDEKLELFLQIIKGSAIDWNNWGKFHNS